MAIHEYRCLECAENFKEVVHSMNSSVARTCARCHGAKVKKLLSAFGVQTSGSASEPVCPTCMPRDQARSQAEVVGRRQVIIAE